jgi:hypothetical protein
MNLDPTCDIYEEYYPKLLSVMGDMDKMVKYLETGKNSIKTLSAECLDIKKTIDELEELSAECLDINKTINELEKKLIYKQREAKIAQQYYDVVENEVNRDNYYNMIEQLQNVELLTDEQKNELLNCNVVCCKDACRAKLQLIVDKIILVQDKFNGELKLHSIETLLKCEDITMENYAYCVKFYDANDANRNIYLIVYF